MNGKLKDLEYYTKLSYRTEVLPSKTTEGEFCYIAFHPELVGCMSHGDTPQEAMDNLSEAKSLYIKTLLEKGQSIPPPKSSEVVIWEINYVSWGISEERLPLIAGEINPIKSLEPVGV